MSETASQGRGSAALARSSALMASGTLVSRLLGLVRVLLLAGAIGLLSGPGNAWSTANTLPNTVYILLAGGILNVILVPSITRAMNQPDAGRDFTDRLLTLALLSLAGIAVVFTAGAALLTRLYAWTWDGSQFALAVSFAYLCLPQIFFYGLYTVLGQILNAHEKFGYYMWAPVANNIVAIAGILVFRALYPNAADLPPGSWTSGMVWLLGGTATLGVVTQALVLVVPVWRSGFRYRPRWGFRGVGLGSASRMALWMLGVVGVSQAGMWLSTNVLNRASDIDQLAAGKIIYENAFLFFILPHSLIATSLITAMFTRMSRAAHAEDLPELSRQYRHGLRLLGVAMVPISVGLFVLAPSLTSVLLAQNTPRETLATAHVLMALVVGLSPYGIYILSGRIFHAFQDGRTPFKMQLAITAVAGSGTLFAATLPAAATAIGIGLSQTAGQLVAAVLGLTWVRRRLGGLPLGDVARTYRRVLLATAVAAVPTVLVSWGASTLLLDPWAALVSLLLGGPVMLGCYALLAHRLGVTEVAEVAAPVARRLRLARFLPARAAGAPGATTTGPAAEGPAGRGGDTLGLAHGRDGTEDGHDLPRPVAPADEASPAREEFSVHGIEPGRVLGDRYLLQDLLARRDDTLDYWSARDVTLDRTVAVTVLPSEGEHAEVSEAVLDGARRTAGVDDPRLVRVLDVGQEDGLSWIVEEGLVDAESLASLVADRPLPAEETRRIVGEAATGLETARRRGLHHLFLSPYAVLCTREGAVKVSGVAVAAALEQTEEISAVEASLVDTADLVSLLYTGLTGRWPGEEMEGLRPARRLADGSLPAPSEVVAGVPGDLDALCRQMLALDFDPDAGPQTPGELARQLAPWSPEPVRDQQVSGPDAPLGRSAAGAALGGAAGATAASDRGERGRTPEEEQEAYFRTGPQTGAAGASAAAVAGAAGTGQGAGAGDPGTWSGRPGQDDPDSDRAEEPLEEPHTAYGGPTVPPEERDRPASRQTGMVLLVLLAVVAVAVVLAFGAFRGLLGDGEDTGAPDAGPAQTAEPTGQDQSDQTGGGGDGGDGGGQDQDQQTEEPATSPGDPIQPAGITSYDPEGDGDERNDIVAQAIDGDSSTSWNSHTYLSSGWGNLKSGVGLAVDLGESQEVHEVEVQFPQGDYGAEVFVGDSQGTDGTSLGSADDASGTWTVTPDEAATGRYVTVWFDRAWDGPSGEIVHVSEITVRGGS